MNTLPPSAGTGTVAPPQEKAAQKSLQSWLAPAALGLLVLTVWFLQRPYRGLGHDSMLYTLLALARLHPGTLNNDLFLRYGSQGDYTVFSPLYAAAIRAFDLEPAAALLTFLGQVAFFAAAWVLVRRVMSARQALLAIGLLIALPSDYGANHVFNYLEGFLTPRQMAEALVLTALTAALVGRAGLAAVCLLAGMLLHPIMACTGFVMLFCLYVALPRPRLAAVIAAATLLGTLALVLLFPVGPLRPFDEPWLYIVHFTSKYLFLSLWSLRDWCHLCVPAAVLIIGALRSETPLVRRLCVASLLTAACGIVANLIFCDLLHVVILTQVQPWRWLWIAQTLAVLLLPLIVADCWRTGLLGRAAIILLAGAYELRDLPPALGIVLGAIACAALANRPQGARRYPGLILFGSGALLVVALGINLLPHMAYPASYTGLNLPQRAAQWLNLWAGDGLVYAVLLALTYWLGVRRPLSFTIVPLVVTAALVCLFGPMGWELWTKPHYTPALRALVARWRALIPERAQVIWPDSPVTLWYLLERPAYWSFAEVAGDIFSSQKAFEMQRRSMALQLALDASAGVERSLAFALPLGTDNLNALGLTKLCADPELSFVVSPTPLGVRSYSEIAPDPSRPDALLRLYSCAQLRQSQ